MKLITLNLWGGIVYEPLMEFIQKISPEVDIFCFQEMLIGNKPGFSADKKVRLNLSTEIHKVLPDFQIFLYPAKPGSYFGGESVPLPDGSQVGQAIYVKNDLGVISSGGFRTYDENSPHAKDLGVTVTGNFQYVQIKLEQTFLTIGNLHGIWQKGSEKLDTRERLEQTTKMLEFLKLQKGVHILAGDFNTKPDIKCMGMIEQNMISLVRKYGVQSTRTNLYTKPIKYSDYVFISKEVEVKNFEVLSYTVSDHAPLLVEFEV